MLVHPHDDQIQSGVIFSKMRILIHEMRRFSTMVKVVCHLVGEDGWVSEVQMKKGFRWIPTHSE